MKAKQLIIAVAVLAILTGLALMRNRDPFEKLDRQSFSSLIPARTEGSIDRIQVKNKEGEVSAEKRGDVWWISDPQAFVADENGLKAAASYLEKLTISDIASRKRERQVEYGVTPDSPESVQVKASSKGTEVLNLTAGKLTSDFKGNFIVLASAPDLVYTTSEVLPFIFTKGLKDWRTKVILDIPREDVEMIQVTNAAGSFQLDKDAEGKWRKMDEPSWIADPNRTAQLTGGFTKLLWTDVLDEPDPAADYGFSNPTAKVTLRTKGTPHTLTLVVGKETTEPKGNVWIRLEGDPKLYQVRKGQVDRLTKAADYYSENKSDMTQQGTDQPKPAAEAQKPEQDQGNRNEVKERKGKEAPSKLQKPKAASVPARQKP